MSKFTLKKERKTFTIMSKPHSHIQTMNETSAKLRNDRTKTVREFALYCVYGGTDGRTHINSFIRHTSRDKI